ncbi:MAG: hypothetical protein MUF34_24460, partial [Polyangiaceae bacterium]|nr:hypothetical protein [Polyangiaceae bacterium]
MRRGFAGGVLGSFSALVLSATTLTGSGCSLFEDEGEYEAPAGFSVAQTSRVAIAPGVFVREGGHVRSGAAVLRESRPEVAAGAEPGARPRIESEFHGSYADGMRVNASSNPLAYVDVLPEGATAAPGRVRHDGAVLAFENAFPGVTSAFGADDHKVEEFLTIPSIEAVPSLAYTLRSGPEFGEWVEEEGTLWAFDKQGRGLFTLAPPVIEDARGKSVTGSWAFAPVEGGVRITPRVDWSSLEFPVLFDPTFETPIWFIASRPADPVARAGAGSAFYPLDHNCSIVFGGTGAGAIDRNDVNLYCNRLWQRGIVTSTPRPSERSYVAMGYVPTPQVTTAGAYLFGGYTSDSVGPGPSNEFWLLNLSGTTTKTGTWTQIAPPDPITPDNWPEPRFMAGLGYSSEGLILFGGVGPQGQTYRDTWRYDGTSWAKVCDNCFEGRFGLAAAQLGTEAAPELVAFGGYEVETNALTNTVQRFTGTGWETITIDPLPVPANGSGSNFIGDVEP